MAAAISFLFVNFCFQVWDFRRCARQFRLITNVRFGYYFMNMASPMYQKVIKMLRM